MQPGETLVWLYYFIKMAAKKQIKWTKMYSRWAEMVRRCTYPSNKGFHNYGGRGIKVCHEWLTSFDQFCKDMGELPISENAKYSIERINNEGNYEPSNCKWATSKEQTRNRRRTVFLTAFGETMCVRDWVIKTEITHGTIGNYMKLGFSLEETIIYVEHKKEKKRRQISELK